MGRRENSSNSELRHSRRELIVALAFGAAGAPLCALAQQPPKIPKVAWISGGGSPAEEARFEQQMEARFRELGWFYKRNLQYEIRRYRSDPTLMQKIATEIVAMQCDAILAGDIFVVATLLQSGAKGPIVVQGASNMQEFGLIASYARPGGNVTGLAWDQSADIVGKYPEFLKEMVPGLAKVGILFDPTQPRGEYFLEIVRRAIAKLGLIAVVVEVRAPPDIDTAFAKLAAQGVQAVEVWGSALTYIAMEQIIQLTTRYKLPDISIFRRATELGGLMSYGANTLDMYVRAIDYVDKILRGANPAELPVEQPTKYELIINMKRARELGLKVPTSLQIRADELIE